MDLPKINFKNPILNTPLNNVYNCRDITHLRVAVRQANNDICYAIDPKKDRMREKMGSEQIGWYYQFTPDDDLFEKYEASFAELRKTLFILVAILELAVAALFYFEILGLKVSLLLAGIISLVLISYIKKPDYRAMAKMNILTKLEEVCDKHAIEKNISI